MKKFVLSIFAAIAALFAMPTESEAGNFSIHFGHSSGGYYNSGYNPYGGYSSYNRCNSSPRVVRTAIVSRRPIRTYRTLSCGRRVAYTATQVKYCQYYSNGARRYYTRTHY